MIKHNEYVKDNPHYALSMVEAKIDALANALGLGMTEDGVYEGRSEAIPRIKRAYTRRKRFGNAEKVAKKPAYNPNTVKNVPSEVWKEVHALPVGGKYDVTEIARARGITFKQMAYRTWHMQANYRKRLGTDRRFFLERVNGSMIINRTA